MRPGSRAPKRERVARGVRAAIERGDYADGSALSQSRLAAQYGVHRQVIGDALWTLERQGYVSPGERKRFYVNASYASRQSQLTRNELQRLDLYLTRVLVILGDNPARLL